MSRSTRTNGREGASCCTRQTRSNFASGDQGFRRQRLFQLESCRHRQRSRNRRRHGLSLFQKQRRYSAFVFRPRDGRIYRRRQKRDRRNRKRRREIAAHRPAASGKSWAQTAIWRLFFRSNCAAQPNLCRNFPLPDLPNISTSFVQTIAEGQKQGVFRKDLKPIVCAKILYGALDEMVTNWILSKKSYPLAPMADEVLKVFFGGVMQK